MVAPTGVAPEVLILVGHAALGPGLLFHIVRAGRIVGASVRLGGGTRQLDYRWRAGDWRARGNYPGVPAVASSVGGDEVSGQVLAGKSAAIVPDGAYTAELVDDLTGSVCGIHETSVGVSLGNDVGTDTVLEATGDRAGCRHRHSAVLNTLLVGPATDIRTRYHTKAVEGIIIVLAVPVSCLLSPRIDDPIVVVIADIVAPRVKQDVAGAEDFPSVLHRGLRFGRRA